MPQRALALEARAAVDVQPEHARVGDAGGVCSGLDEPNSATCGRPSAAATCISPESLLTTDARAGDQADRLVERGAARPGSSPRMPRAASRSLRRAEQHRRHRQARRELGEVGPALGRPVLGAGAEHHVAAAKAEAAPASRRPRRGVTSSRGRGSSRRARRPGARSAPASAASVFGRREVEQAVARFRRRSRCAAGCRRRTAPAPTSSVFGSTIAWS